MNVNTMAVSKITESASSNNESGVVLSNGYHSEWADKLPEAMVLDNLMRCPICFDYINTAMMLPSCSHNYCSLCIRQYFQYKTQCPTCGMPASDPDLRNNRILDSIVKQFLEFRKAIGTCLNENPTRQTSSDRNLNSFPVSSVTESKLSADKKSKYFTCSKISSHKIFDSKTVTSDVDSKRHLPGNVEIEISDDDSEDSTVRKNDDIQMGHGDNSKTSSKSTASNLISKSGQPSQVVPPCADNTDTSKVNEQKTSEKDGLLQTFSLESKQNEKSTLICVPVRTPGNTSNKVACPVCGVPVRECYVNLHLDRCLREDGPPKITKRKPLTKMVYNLMSDKELKKKLKELGLSTQGDRQMLIKRHREFLMFYNADGDSLNPRPLSVLVQEFEKLEKMKHQMSKRLNHSSVAVKKDSKPEEIRKAQKQYAKTNNSQYSTLMADVKKRMAAAKYSRMSTRNKDGGDADENNAAMKSCLQEGLCPPSVCNVLPGLKDSPVQDTLVSNKPPSFGNNSHNTTLCLTDNQYIKCESKNLENIDVKQQLPVQYNPHLSSSAKKDLLHESHSPKSKSVFGCKSPKKASTRHSEEKIPIGSVDQLNLSTEISSSSQTIQPAVEDSVLNSQVGDGIKNDTSCASFSLTDNDPEIFCENLPNIPDPVEKSDTAKPDDDFKKLSPSKLKRHLESPVKKLSSLRKELFHKRISLTKQTSSTKPKLLMNEGSPRNKVANMQVNKTVLTDSVHQFIASTQDVSSSQSPVRSSPRKLFSPNTAGIACSVLSSAAAPVCPKQLYVEDSDPEEANEISFMDAIAESIDKFGSESFLERSPASKDLWPALSQTSQSSSCDMINQLGLRPDGAPDGTKEPSVAIGQEQDGTISSSESDILDCVNEVMQVTVDLGIATRQQKAKSRVLSVRRSARCKKRTSETAAEDSTPKRKKR